MTDPSYEQRIQHHREEKDRFFAEHPHSPIPPDERATFQGLAYFPVDPEYRFEVELRGAAPEALTIPTSAGTAVTYQRVGTFHLDLPVGPVDLAAYATEDHEEELFLPFQDATSGKETYGAGRYLEATPLGEGRYQVDLNLAYHPFCAYNDAYACPLPPPENRVEPPIRAGERLP